MDSNLISIISLISAAWVAIFLYLSFTARIHLRIKPSWVSKQSVIIRIEIENKAKVRVKKKRARLQVLHYKIKEQKKISEMGPRFLKINSKKMKSHQIGKAQLIFSSPHYIYIQETDIIAIEDCILLRRNISFCTWDYNFKPL